MLVIRLTICISLFKCCEDISNKMHIVNTNVFILQYVASVVDKSGEAPQ